MSKRHHYSENNDFVVVVVAVKGYKWIVSAFIGLKWLITFQFIWLCERSRCPWWAFHMSSNHIAFMSTNIYIRNKCINGWTNERDPSYKLIGSKLVQLCIWIVCRCLNNTYNAIAPSQLNAGEEKNNNHNNNITAHNQNEHSSSCNVYALQAVHESISIVLFIFNRLCYWFSFGWSCCCMHSMHSIEKQIVWNMINALASPRVPNKYASI